MECGQPILVVCKKLGVCKVDPAGKPCSTLFTRISYNGTSSVVMCKCVYVCVLQSCSGYFSNVYVVSLSSVHEDTSSLGKGTSEQRTNDSGKTPKP